MLADIAAQYTEVGQTFAEAADILGYDLWKLCQQGPVEALNKTVHTQPALLAASYAVWRILQTRSSIQPQVFAGHSLGEYTALVCVNALSFRDAVKLVAARGQFMQEAVAADQGAMAAIIGLDDQAVTAICHEAATANEIVSPANFNSTGQVVVAGHKAAVEKVMAQAKAQGAKLVMQIPVSVPSHCALMRPAAERLAKLLAETTLRAPSAAVINNVDVKDYTNEASIRDGLTRQLYMPVRWVETIQNIAGRGIGTIIECGPGKVLTGLNKRINKNLELLTTADLPSLQSLLSERCV